MLFKDYHLPQIRSGSKTVTRREWAENYNRPRVGSVQIASDEMFTSDADADCYIRVLDVYDQPLGDMTDADARAEGDYDDLAEFRAGYEQVYGDGAWDDEKVVAVVEFEYVGRERPTEDGDESESEQSTLVTDGGTVSPEARRCPHCEATHAEWEARGERTFERGGHAGISHRLKCLRCGGIDEVDRR